MAEVSAEQSCLALPVYSCRIPHIIAHRNWVRSIAKRYGFPERRTTVIALGNTPDAPNAADLPRPAHSDASPLLVTVGGVAHTKGQHDAIVAVSELRNWYPGILYQIIGEIRDPSYLRSLVALIAKLKLQPHVQILQKLSREEKELAVATADVYLQPSHEEGFCLAFLEAASVVSRIVATDAGTMRLVCGSDPGARNVPIQNPMALAAAARSLLMAELPTDLLAARRRRLGVEFGWEQYTVAHENLYQSIFGRMSPKIHELASINR